MKTKNLIVLIAVAVVLGIAAVALNTGSKPAVPRLNGKTVLPGLDISKVARIECGQLVIASGKDGWKVESYHGYPAASEKLTENLLKLTELKVGQVARGKKLEKTTDLVLKDEKGGVVASLKLGDKHPKYGHGRYLAFEGESVLVSDMLDVYDGDEKRWIETKIVDEPWISFNKLGDLKNEAEYGFKTGITAKVTIAGNTNRVMTIGGVVKGGSDRYVKLDGSKWVYEVSSYSVDKFLPKPPPEPKKEEPKKAEPAKKENKDKPAK